MSNRSPHLPGYFLSRCRDGRSCQMNLLVKDKTISIHSRDMRLSPCYVAAETTKILGTTIYWVLAEQTTAVVTRQTATKMTQ